MATLQILFILLSILLVLYAIILLIMSEIQFRHWEKKNKELHGLSNNLEKQSGSDNEPQKRRKKRP